MNRIALGRENKKLEHLSVGKDVGELSIDIDVGGTLSLSPISPFLMHSM